MIAFILKGALFGVALVQFHYSDGVSDCLCRFCHDTVDHNNELMICVVPQVGVDRIVMRSDYCFQIGDEHPVATVNRLSGSISMGR